MSPERGRSERQSRCTLCDGSPPLKISLKKTEVAFAFHHIPEAAATRDHVLFKLGNRPDRRNTRLILSTPRSRCREIAPRRPFGARAVHEVSFHGVACHVIET